MKEIITLPFRETEVNETYKLPNELSHLLEFVNADKIYVFKSITSKYFDYYYLYLL